jgi:DNA-directed RNA polymerase specialized sigma24 family protein
VTAKDELELANKFDRQRPQLRAVAYRILGSLSEAEDTVQEAWLRLRRTDAEQIDSLERWLTTVVGDGAVAIDVFNDPELVAKLDIGGITA